MTTRATKTGVVGVLVALAACLVWLASTHGCAERAHDAPVATTAGAVEPAAVSGGEEPASVTLTDDHPPAEGARPVAADAKAPNVVAQLMRTTDAADRALLADIEKQTRAPAPPEVFELMRMARAGSERAALERFIEDKLASKLLVRMAAERWLRAKNARLGAQPEAEKSALPEAFGAGGGDRRIAPISKQPPAANEH